MDKSVRVAEAKCEQSIETIISSFGIDGENGCNLAEIGIFSVRLAGENGCDLSSSLPYKLKAETVKWVYAWNIQGIPTCYAHWHRR